MRAVRRAIGLEGDAAAARAKRAHHGPTGAVAVGHDFIAAAAGESRSPRIRAGVADGADQPSVSRAGGKIRGRVRGDLNRGRHIDIARGEAAASRDQIDISAGIRRACRSALQGDTRTDGAEAVGTPAVGRDSAAIPAAAIAADERRASPAGAAGGVRRCELYASGVVAGAGGKRVGDDDIAISAAGRDARVEGHPQGVDLPGQTAAQGVIHAAGHIAEVGIAEGRRSGPDREKRWGSRSTDSAAAAARGPKGDGVRPEAGSRVLDADRVIVLPRRCPESDIALRVSGRLAGGRIRVGRVLRAIGAGYGGAGIGRRVIRAGYLVRRGVADREQRRVRRRIRHQKGRARDRVHRGKRRGIADILGRGARGEERRKNDGEK